MLVELTTFQLFPEELTQTPGKPEGKGQLEIGPCGGQERKRAAEHSGCPYNIEADWFHLTREVDQKILEQSHRIVLVGKDL